MKLNKIKTKKGVLFGGIQAEVSWPALAPLRCAFTTDGSTQCRREKKQNLKMLENKKTWRVGAVSWRRLPSTREISGVPWWRRCTVPWFLWFILTTVRGVFFFVHERRGSRCQSLVWSCGSLRGQRSLQASAAFLLEPFVLASAPSAFLEPLGRPAVTAVVAVVGFVSEQTPWSWLSGPSSSSCSRQHSCPVAGQGRSAPSWWALQKEFGQSWQKASEFFPQTSQWCQGQSQRPAGKPWN